MDKALKLEIHMQALNSELEALRSLRSLDDHLFDERGNTAGEFDAYSIATADGRDVQKELQDAMSEFEKLKGQLAEAEERLKRLEDTNKGRSHSLT